MHDSRRLGLVLCGSMMAACGGGGAEPDSGVPEPSDAGDAAVDGATGGLFDVHHRLDVLFVIDSSGSMGEEQISLVSHFREFAGLVNRAFPRTVSLHAGIVSADMGTGRDFGLSNCDASGDGGRLQDTPRVSGCEPPADPYMSNDPFNYPLLEAQDTFECISQLGVAGCGFEQPLESMKAALDGSDPYNDGFLRPDADLLVLLVTDEDDCSALGSTLFDPDAADLGPLSSYRCFRHGFECDQDLDSPGPKTSCRTRDGGLLHPVSRYTDFLDGLATGGRRVFVAAIAGETAAVEVRQNTDGLTLEPGCVSSLGVADPALRLKELTDHFGERGFFASICREDWSEAALSDVMDWMAGHLGDPCLSSERVGDGSGCVMHKLAESGQVEVERCPEPTELADGGVVYPDDTPDPCWELRTSSAYCALVRDLDAAELLYRTAMPPSGDRIRFECPAR